MRKRKCKVCRSNYTPVRPLQSVCERYECAVAHGRVMREKAQRKATRQRKEGMRTKSQWLKLAQTEFNAMIRLRDRDRPCVSCGHQGNRQMHAGHYRPVGGLGAPYRFTEINCHVQCSICNNHKSGSLTTYRAELIERIGLDLVEWLEVDRPPLKLTIEEIKAIRDYYKNARKAMIMTAGEVEPF